MLQLRAVKRPRRSARSMTQPPPGVGTSCRSRQDRCSQGGPRYDADSSLRICRLESESLTACRGVRGQLDPGSRETAGRHDGSLNSLAWRTPGCRGSCPPKEKPFPSLSLCIGSRTASTVDVAAPPPAERLG